MLKLSFPSLISKKPGEIPIFRTFLAKNTILCLYFTVNQQFGQNQQLWRHCDVIRRMFVVSATIGKRRPIAIPWYQISILQAFIFQIHRGLQQAPPLTQNCLVWQGLNYTLRWQWSQFTSTVATHSATALPRDYLSVSIRQCTVFLHNSRRKWSTSGFRNF